MKIIFITGNKKVSPEEKLLFAIFTFSKNEFFSNLEEAGKRQINSANAVIYLNPSDIKKMGEEQECIYKWRKRKDPKTPFVIMYILRGGERIILNDFEINILKLLKTKV